MKKLHRSSAPATPTPRIVERSTGTIQAWVRFWFAPADPIALHVLRVAFGIFFLASLLPFAGYQSEFLGLQGWLDQRAYQDIARVPDGPSIPMWSLYYLCGSSSTLVAMVYWTSIAVVALFTLGICTRITSILSWVALASFTSNPAIAYDGDFLLTMPAFYLMVGYILLGLRRRGSSPAAILLGSGESFVFRRSSRTEEEIERGSIGANLAVRLLQVHFAIVLMTSGLHKLQIGDWWAGVAYWFPLHPPFETTVEDLRRPLAQADSYFTMLSLAGYATLAWQLGFPFFAWRQAWWCRSLLLIGALVAWIGNAFLYRLPLFGPGIFICCLSYVKAEEWRGLLRMLGLSSGLRSIEDSQSSQANATAPKAEAVAS
jgi:hypothetical protein